MTPHCPISIKETLITRTETNHIAIIMIEEEETLTMVNKMFKIVILGILDNKFIRKTIKSPHLGVRSNLKLSKTLRSTAQKSLS